MLDARGLSGPPSKAEISVLNDFLTILPVADASRGVANDIRMVATEEVS